MTEAGTAPGMHTEAPGRHTKAPGRHAKAPGRHTKAPGRHTKAPGRHTKAPSRHATVWLRPRRVSSAKPPAPRHLQPDAHQALQARRVHTQAKGCTPETKAASDLWPTRTWRVHNLGARAQSGPFVGAHAHHAHQRPKLACAQQQSHPVTAGSAGSVQS